MRPSRADQVAVYCGLYAVDQPDSDLPADFAEELWSQYESALPGAVRTVESGTYTREDWAVILLHVQAQSIRYPDFDHVAELYFARNGVNNAGRDLRQRQRLRTFDETREWMADARFAVLRRGEIARRFLINDKGFASMEDVLLQVRGAVFPLTGETAVAMAVGTAQPGDDDEAGPVAHRTLTGAAMDIINAATWRHVDIDCVIGHPEDTSWIADLQLTTGALQMPRLGPFRGTGEAGMFDWAVPAAERG